MDIDTITNLKKISQKLRRSVIRELSGLARVIRLVAWDLLTLWQFCIFMPCDWILIILIGKIETFS